MAVTLKLEKGQKIELEKVAPGLEIFTLVCHGPTQN